MKIDPPVRGALHIIEPESKNVRPSRFTVLCFEIILVLSGLLGAAFNCFGSVWGFIIWLPCNIGLAWLNHKRGLKWQTALFAAYTLTAAWGIYNGLKH